MLTSPWNTTVLRKHKLSTLISELAMAKATGGLVQDSESVIFVTPLAEKVPVFVMPVTSVEYGERKLNDNGAVFMDARSFMRREQRSDTGFVVANQMQADFFSRMGDLTALWIKDVTVREDFMRTSDLPAQVYISWLSQSIANKLGLDLDVAREVQIITGVYYAQRFFSPEEVLSERGREKVVKLIQRWTRAPIQLITAIVDDLPYMSLLEEYVAALHTHFAQNTRISQINVGFLIMTLGRSWFGYGAQEIAAVALEYPPVYLALVEAACNGKVWRKTHLGKLVERFAVGRIGDEFSRSMEVLAGQSRAKSGVTNRRASMEAHQGSSVSDQDIADAEKELKVTFAPDYVEFLRTYGFGVWGSHEICGLGKAGHLNVVDETQSFKKYLKPGRYVIENVGIDSLVVVADAIGKVYLASPHSEKPLNTTFSQYLKDVIAGKR